MKALRKVDNSVVGIKQYLDFKALFIVEKLQQWAGQYQTLDQINR